MKNYDLAYTSNLQRRANKLLKYIKKLPENIVNKLLNKNLENGNKLRYKVNNMKSIKFRFLGQGDECLVYRVDLFAIKFYIGKDNYDVHILKKLRELYNNHTTINTVILYHSLVLYNHMVTIVNVISGTLDNWMKEITKPKYLLAKHLQNYNEEWILLMIQILYALYVLKKKLSLYHGDLTHRNILYIRLNKPVKIIYNIDNNNIEFITDIIFIIADFGKSQSLIYENKELPKHKKITNEELKLYISNNKDLEHLSGLYNKSIVDYMYKFYPYNKLREILKKDKYIDNILKEKKEYLLNKDMKQPPPSYYIDIQLRREMCYHILENNYIDIDSIPNIKKEILLPSKEIRNNLQELKSDISIMSKILELYKLLHKYNNLQKNNINILKFNLQI